MKRWICLLLMTAALWLPYGASAGTTRILPPTSIYALQVPLTDQRGETVRLDLFQGHPTIVSMFYGTCPAACPMLITTLKKMEASLTAAERSRVRVLLISFDPMRDTPAALQSLVAKYDLDGARWRLAQPVPRDVRAIASVLNFRYRATADGEFDHDSLITLLDGNGVPVTQIENSGEAIGALARIIHERSW